MITESEDCKSENGPFSILATEDVVIVCWQNLIDILNDVVFTNMEDFSQNP